MTGYCPYVKIWISAVFYSRFCELVLVDSILFHDVLLWMCQSLFVTGSCSYMKSLVLLP